MMPGISFSLVFVRTGHPEYRRAEEIQSVSLDAEDFAACAYALEYTTENPLHSRNL